MGGAQDSRNLALWGEEKWGEARRQRSEGKNSPRRIPGHRRAGCPLADQESAAFIDYGEPRMSDVRDLREELRVERPKNWGNADWGNQMPAIARCTSRRSMPHKRPSPLTRLG